MPHYSDWLSKIRVVRDDNRCLKIILVGIYQ